MDQNALNKELRRYATPDTKRSVVQTSITLAIYLTAITLMIVLLHFKIHYLIILLLSLLTAPILVRLFIIFHDCCHISYFKSSKACSTLGHFLGILTFTSYSDWQRTHSIHHRFVANLEKRGIGDVWLMTVDEYNKAGKWQKIMYRLYRHPLVILLVFPLFLFIVLNRFPSSGFRRKELLSVLFTDAMILLMILCYSLLIGWKECLLILLPMQLGASLIGVWLFYVQHQFRQVYWAHYKEWDRYRAAMEGSSFYKLPTMLRWLSGNIGYHHIHHLAPRIPNYRLKECFDEIPALQKIDPVHYLRGLQNINLSLWDETHGQLVSFREANALLAATK